MRRLLCRWRGHDWDMDVVYNMTTRVITDRCERCGYEEHRRLTALGSAIYEDDKPHRDWMRR